MKVKTAVAERFGLTDHDMHGHRETTTVINNFSYSVWRENVCMVCQEWRTRGKEVKLKAHGRIKRGHNT